MLTRVDIQNFRCLSSVRAELRPLTVLIGENDTGKSAFIAALQTVFRGGKLPTTDHWRLDMSQAIKIIAWYGGVPFKIERDPSDRHQ